MDICDWRDKIDDLDRKLAVLLNERAAAVVEIGRLKRQLGMGIYEPNRERQVLENVQEQQHRAAGRGRPDQDLRAIVGRDRNIQKREIAPEDPPRTRDRAGFAV